MKIFNNENIHFTKFIDLFITISQKELDNNISIQQCFEIWKELGHRISDKDFTTSKQQRKNSNPTETELKIVFIYENIIAILARYSFMLKMGLIRSNNLINFIEIWKKLQSNSKYKFLFKYDVFSILLEMDQNILNEIMTALNSLFEKISSILLEMKPDAFISFLYQKILDKRTRKYLGEFYTPKNLIKLMIATVKNIEIRESHQLNVIDPSCGASALLLPFYDFLKNPKDSYIIGIDINPLAVLLSKILIIQKIQDKEQFYEPLIFCADSLLLYEKQKGLDQFYKETSHNIEIEFLSETIEIHLPTVLNNDLFIMRKEIRSLLENKNFLSFPKNIEKMLFNSFSDYIKELLVDRICVSILLKQKYDLIIGNPPYMRVQNIHPLWKRNEYKKKFSSAIGHFDLYALFIELGLEILNNGGKLCYISSNKFMKTSSGVHIRRIITKCSNVRYLIDFTDSHVFNAMVLPAIYVLEKKNGSDKFPYIKIQKQKQIQNPKNFTFNEFITLILSEVKIQTSLSVSKEKKISIEKFLTNQPPINEKPWTFLDTSDLDLLKKIEISANNQTLYDISKKIYVGIKTTANYAFIDDYNNTFFTVNPEINIENAKIKSLYGKSLFLPVLKGANVRKYKITWNASEKGSYILYPHYKDQNGNIICIKEEVIPKTIEYLKTKNYYESLKAREYVEEAGRAWFEIWNTKDPDLMLSPLKIITPDISPKNNFAIDDKQFFIDGTCYIVILNVNTRKNYAYTLGILNSKVAEYYHKCKSSNQLYAGRYRYFSTNIRFIPIPKADPGLIDEISLLVEELIKNPLNIGLENELNNVIYSVFNLNQNDIDYIEKWIELNELRLK